MSIEELFKAVVAAVEANTKAMINLEASLAGRTPSKSAEKAEKAEKADKPAAKGKEDPKPEIKEEPKADDAIHQDENGDEVVGVEEAAAPLPYETARALVLKLANAGKRAEIPQVFKAHGIDNLKKLLDKEDDFTTVNDQTKLEAVYGDLQKLEG